MKPFTVHEIADAVGGVWQNPRDGAPLVAEVSTDSRKITPGCLFIPLRGEKFDGHRFVEGALEAGAAGVICAQLPEQLRPDKFYILVADTRLALKELARANRRRYSIPFVQITGSVGKTTTKEMIATVLSARYNVLKTQGNFNNDIGTPLTLLGLEPEHEAAVIETGMNHFGEIRYLGDLVEPDIAVISNVGDAHIEFLGSREGILQAKSEIFEHLKPGGLAVLNGDDPLLNTLELPFETLRCGKDGRCSVRVTEVADRGVSGVRCTVETQTRTYHLEIPAPGEHMVYSASMAVAIAERLGLTEEEICRGVAAYRPAGSRMNVIRLAGGRTILDDCYNANPQSVAASLEVLARSDSDRKVAVLGDMGELGDLAELAHYNTGALAAMLGIDRVIAIGTLAADIARGAEDSGADTLHFATKEEGLAAIREAFGENTVMLIKASHYMNFGWLVDQLSK